MLFSKNGVMMDNDERLLQEDPHYPQQAVYTSVRTYHGKPFCLDQHLNRLQDSASRMGFEIPHSIEMIRIWVLDLIQISTFSPHFLRITATPENIFILSRPLDIDPRVYEGVRVTLEPVVRKDVKIKAVDTPDTIEAYEQAQDEGFYEALLLNEDQEMITEGSRSNILWIKEGTLYWCNQALSGITQAAVLGLAEKLKIPTQQASLPVEDLEHLEEFFLTQTSRGIVPIISVDGLRIGDGKVGPQTRKLMHAFQELTAHTS